MKNRVLLVRKNQLTLTGDCTRQVDELSAVGISEDI